MRATCATCKHRHVQYTTNSIFEFLDRMKDDGWKVLPSDPKNHRARYQCPDCSKKEKLMKVYTVCFLSHLNGVMSGSVHLVIVAESPEMAIHVATTQLEVFSKNGVSFQIADVSPVRFICELQPNSFIAFSNGLWL